MSRSGRGRGSAYQADGGDGTQETPLLNSNTSAIAVSRTHPRLDVDAESDDPYQRSSISRAEVARRIVAEQDVGKFVATMGQMVWAGFLISMAVGFVTTGIPSAFGDAAIETPALALLQGFIIYGIYRMASHIATHYDADIMLLFLRMLMPLITTDLKMDFWMRRRHRWRDLAWVWISTPFLIASLLGGWIGGSALLGYINDSYSTIGNPSSSGNPGFGVYDRTDIFAVVGFVTAFVYSTFGAHKILTSNGHVRHMIDIYKEEEVEGVTERELEKYAIMRAIQYVVNVALTDSPVIMEQLIAGTIIDSTTGNVGFWVATLFAGFGVAFVFLFLTHHALGFWTTRIRHPKALSSDQYKFSS